MTRNRCFYLRLLVGGWWLSGLFALGYAPLALEPLANSRLRGTGRSAGRRRRLGSLVESLQRGRPRRCPVAELRSRTGRRGRDHRARGGQHSVANGIGEAGTVHIDGDRHGRVGCVRVLTTGSAGTRGNPRHSFSRKSQATRRSVHTIDRFHCLIVATAARCCGPH